jgi:hypothetical protein
MSNIALIHIYPVYMCKKIYQKNIKSLVGPPLGRIN